MVPILFLPRLCRNLGSNSAILKNVENYFSSSMSSSVITPYRRSFSAISSSNFLNTARFGSISSRPVSSWQKLSSLSTCSAFRCGLCSNPALQQRPIIVEPVRFYALDAPPRPSTSTTSSEQEAAQETAKQQYTENMKRNTRIVLFVLCGSIVLAIVVSISAYGKPRIDPDGNVIRDEFTDMPFWKQYILRTVNEYVLWYYYIVEPSSEKLLPDQLPPPYYQPKYTLVLELNGVLIHPEWNYSTGWRFKKRPALDKFVQDIGYPHFEVVIYTSEQATIAHPLLDNIDPEWRFMHRLYRDATKYMKRAHVKDLSKLNRDLSKVILVDWDSQAFQLNPENALRIPKWTGDDEDRALIDLASLLLMIADSNVDDVRAVVQYYSQFDDPIKAYVENRKKILEEKMHKLDQKKEQQQDSLTRNFAGRLFGYKRHTSA